MSSGDSGLIFRDPASFRDPSGFVFVDAGVVYRQVNPSCQADFDHLMRSGLAEQLWTKGLMVQHEEVHGSIARDRGAYRILRPELVPFISYPYEWSFGQLQDAALLTLRLQAHALQHGMILKDASAYNVQFVHARPVFIDTLSFQRYAGHGPWVAYRQFCQHFLAPLALMAHRDVRIGQVLRGFIDGLPLDLADTLLPWRAKLRPALFMHLHLHARMQKKHADSTSVPATSRTMDRNALQALIENLASAVRRLRYRPVGTEWVDYYGNTNYSDASSREKEAAVDRLIDRVQPSSVWDLGANTGRFSRLASRKGIPTVAFDVDPAAVERNYRACVESHEQQLLPLVLDLANPSPGLGWASGERASLEARGPADMVLALALVHHLAIGNNVPFSHIAEFFARIGRNLVIEFVPKDDSQVRRLLATRTDIFTEYTEECFLDAFRAFFTVVDAHPLPDSTRRLFHMVRKRT